MEDLRCLITENSSKINELQSELSRQDYSIQLMQKDYEYMKKGLDNIEKQTESKLDDIYNSKDEERKKQLEEIKDLKNYVVKTVIGIGVGAILLYVFPFLK